MLSVFICEDDNRQREILERIVRNYIVIENLEMTISLVTANPLEVLEYLQEHPKTTGLYLLDVDLNHQMNGISLASKIREIDDLGKIIFVTTHGELSYLTFMYKVEALDYIIKDQPKNIQKRVQECIQVAHQRYLNDHSPKKMLYQIKIGDQVKVIPYDEIMFFESATVPHKLILHMENSQLEFYGSIKEVAEIADYFYRCHKSFVVNISNIKNVDKTRNEIQMMNDELCLVSTRRMKQLLVKINTPSSML